MYRNIPVTPPRLIQSYTYENSVVLIATRFYADMAAQLRQLGYVGEIVQVVEYNSFSEYSLSDETIKRKTERMQRGIETLKQIRERYPAEHLVICPNNALGDVYWAMSFLPAYCEKHSICKVVIVVIGNGCRQVAGMFCAENSIIMINSCEMDELVQAVIYNREVNCVIAHHDRPYTDNIIKWLDKHFLSFIDYYRYAVFGLSKGTQPVLPNRLESFENHRQIPGSQTVILSPYAKSVVDLPDSFWNKIVDEYSRKGLYLYTNIVGDEKPINGTLPLSVPIRQMCSAAEHAGTFIGVRSGLCDVLNTANCRKVVVFPDCYYSTTPYKVADFFALPGWESIIRKQMNRPLAF